MELLKRECVQILEKAKDWKDAIRLSVKPLEENGFVLPQYGDAIIRAVEKGGPYIVVSDEIALPHARSEEGVLETQFSVTLFKESVKFEGAEVRKVRLFIAFGAADENSHIDVLAALSDFFDEEEIVYKILSFDNADELYLFLKDKF